MSRFKKTSKMFLASLGIISFMAVAVILEVNVFNKDLSKKTPDDVNYINNTVFDNQIPVIKEESSDTILMPFSNKDVKAIRNFYDYSGNDENQRNSIYYYGYTYMQSEGIDYSNSEMFDVVSILDGKVIEITNDEIFGNTIKIDHSNGIVSVYQCLSEISLKTNDVVKRGAVIGKSGTSTIDNDDSSYLHFELIINKENVNPDLYYNKSVKDI